MTASPSTAQPVPGAQPPPGAEATPPGGLGPADAEEEPPEKRRRKLLILLLLLAAFVLLIGLAIWYLLFRQPIPIPAIPGEPIMPGYVTSVYGASRPMGVAVTPAGDRIYIGATAGDQTALVFDAQGNQLAKMQPPISTGSSHVPVYLAINPLTGDVYVSDRPTASIYVYDAQGNYLRAFTPSDGITGWQPLGIAFDPAGNLYVTDVGQRPQRGARVRSLRQAGPRPGRSRRAQLPERRRDRQRRVRVRDRQQQRAAARLRPGRDHRRQGQPRRRPGQSRPPARPGHRSAGPRLRGGRECPLGLRLRPVHGGRSPASPTSARSAPRVSPTGSFNTPTASRSMRAADSTSPTRPTTGCSCGATELTSAKGGGGPKAPASPPGRRTTSSLRSSEKGGEDSLKRLMLLIAAGSLWLFLAAVPVFADGGPHVAANNSGVNGINADGCAGCHRAHRAQGEPLLLAASETALCLTCHGATGLGVGG